MLFHCELHVSCAWVIPLYQNHSRHHGASTQAVPNLLGKFEHQIRAGKSLGLCRKGMRVKQSAEMMRQNQTELSKVCTSMPLPFTALLSNGNVSRRWQAMHACDIRQQDQPLNGFIISPPNFRVVCAVLGRTYRLTWPNTISVAARFLIIRQRGDCCETSRLK